MPQKLKKGDRIYVTEGPQQGQQGIVTRVRRIFDEDDKENKVGRVGGFRCRRRAD